jgi:L-glyceraldehyde 3-phosphate reductase
LKTNEITEDRLQQVRLLNELAKERSQSLAQMAIAWLLKDKRITTVLIGASTTQQLDNNIDAIQNLGFTKEELGTIENILKK